MTDGGSTPLRAVLHRSTPGGAAVAVERLADGRVEVWPAAEAALLARCRTFVVPDALGPDAAARLLALRARGWLETPDEARVRLVVPDSNPPPVARLLVPTRGPSPHLGRLLDRLAAGSVPVEVLVDDPDPTAAAAVEAGLPRGGAPFTVVGPAARAAFTTALARASGRPDAVDAALGAQAADRWRIGALRNLVLLRAAGRVVLSVDDDVVPEVLATGTGSARLDSAVDPTRWRATTDRASAFASAQPVDLAALFAGVVGRPAAAIVADGDLGPSSASLQAEVEAGAPVVVATLGIAGDSGGSRATSWLAVDARTRAAMLTGWPATLRGRALVRGAPALTVTDSSFFMAPCFAFDGRAALPPFFPRHRNTDGLWGATLRRWARPGLVVHAPLAVRHDPTSARTFAPGDLARHAVAFRTTDLVALHLGAGVVRGATPDDRLAALARHLEALARLPDSAFAEAVTELARGWLAAMAGAIAVARAEPGPADWHAELADADAAVRRALAAPPLPEEHAATGLAGLRDDLVRFAVTLDGWPALRAAAHALA